MTRERFEDRPRFAELEADYEIVRELGRGGTAVVYLARERELGREVALKVIRPQYVQDDEAAARLVREARTVGGLQHPNIVVLYGTRRLLDGSLALIMQFVPGRTLKAEIEGRGPLPFEQIEQILGDVGRALSYAHRHRIVHRDIKPENIYLDALSGIARLSDFGIARPWDSDADLTLPGTAIGTPAYMAPEQIDGGRLDGRSDLYSLGMIAWEMVTGRKPWAGETLFSVIYKQKHEPLPSPATLRPGVPPALEAAIARALAKDPGERWPDVDAFLETLGDGRLHLPRHTPLEPLPEGAPDRRTEPRADDSGDFDGGATIRYRPDEGDDGSTLQYRRADYETALDDAATMQYRPAEVVAGNSPPGPAKPGTSRLRKQVEKPANDGGASLRSEVVEPRPIIPEVAAPLPAVRDATEPAAPVAAVLRPKLGPRSRTAVAAGGLTVLLGSVVAAGVMWPGGAPPPPDPPAPSAASAAAGSGPVVLHVVAGGGQQGFVGDTLGEPLVVRLAGPEGEPMAGYRVLFRVAEGDGVVVPFETSTNDSGIATARWHLRSAGAHRAEASLPDAGGAAAVFKANARQTPPARLLEVAGPGAGERHAGARMPIGVRAVDRQGRPLPGVPIRFTVSAGGGTINPAQVRTDSTGSAGAVWTLGGFGRQQASATTPAVGGLRVAWDGGDLGPPPLPVRAGLAPGAAHGCHLRATGALGCWGANESGQLGDGTVTRRDAPVRIEAPEAFATVSAGISHTCGTTITGAAYCWGSNTWGQLGSDVGDSSPHPVRVNLGERLTAIVAGTAHTCAIAATGALFCWGDNSNGQLGDGTRTSRTVPVRTGGNRRFRVVALGGAHSCALASDETAWCWGRNAGGQLGDGTTSDRTTPIQVAGGHRFVGLTVGGGHSCGLRGDGVLLCWGFNGSGELGTGTRSSSLTPAIVAANVSLTAVAAGSRHTCALGRDGVVLCWGANDYGQLGDGTTTDRVSPTVVVANERFNAVATAATHTCGRSAAGWRCWGLNADGQLGDGTRISRAQPSTRVRTLP